MNGIVWKIIKTAPITIDDNYRTRLAKRIEILNKRRAKLNQPIGLVEYEGGVAARFFPNVNFSKELQTKIDKMKKVIDKELNEIYKLL